MHGVTIISPNELEKVAERAREQDNSFARQQATMIIPDINRLLIDAAKRSHTSLRNEITIPQEILAEICDPENFERRWGANGHMETRYLLRNLNPVGEALVELITEQGYKVSYETLKQNKLFISKDE
jgi:hypothetical protein